MRFTITTCLILLGTFAYAQTSYPPREQNGNWGVWNEKYGCWVIDPDYSNIQEFDDFYKLYNGDLVGILSSNFSFNLAPKYEDVHFDRKNQLITVKKGGKWGSVDRDEKVLVDFIFEDIVALNKKYLKVFDGTSYGVYSTKGEQIIAPEFEAIQFYKYENFYKKDILEISKDGKKGLLTVTGERLLPCLFQNINPGIVIAENIEMPSLFPVEINGKWGFANSKGELQIACEYIEVSPFHKGAAIVQRDKGKYALVNEAGDIITSRDYKYIFGFDAHNDISQVNGERSLNGLINIKGKEILAPEYVTILPFYNPKKDREKVRKKRNGVNRNRGGSTRSSQIHLAENLYMFRAKGHATGIINSKGEIIRPLREAGTYYKFKFGSLNISATQGVKGKMSVLPEGYSKDRPYYKNYYVATKDDKEGVIDVLSNKVIIPFEYDGIHKNSRLSKENCGTDFFVVSKNRKKGVVDQDNNVLIPLEHNRLDLYIKYGVAIVQKNGKEALMNLKGEPLTDFEYDKIHSPKYGYLNFKQGEQRGMLNIAGEVVIPGGKYSSVYAYRPYAPLSGFHHLPPPYCNLRELPDSLQLVAIGVTGESKTMLNAKGEAILSAVPFDFSSDPNISYRYTNDEVFAQVKMPNGDVLTKGDIPATLIEKEMKRNGGFFALNGKGDHPKSIYLLKTHETVVFDRVESKSGLGAPVRWVKKGKQYGLINNMGTLITPVHFDKMGTFSENLIAAVKDGKVGFLDMTGQVAIPFDFDDDIYSYQPPSVFTNGHAVVLKDGLYGVINKQGKIVVPCSFVGVSYFDGIELLGFKNGKWEMVVVE